MGGGGELEREPGALVLPGAGFIEFSLDMSPTYTGFQYGYRVAPDEEWTWLPQARGPVVHQVGVLRGQTEEDAIKWAFAYRMNMPAEQDCYTGGGAGTLQGEIAAVR